MPSYTTKQSAEFDPYFLAEGQLASKWAEFELVLNSAIWELANVEKLVGGCITSQMIGPAPRFRCLASLLNLRNAPAELVKELNSLSSRAEGLGGQRNRYLHDPLV